MLCWELLPPDTTITAEIYCNQLENLRAVVAKRRPEYDKIYFFHDNARPHVAKSTRNKLLEFNWKLIPHPPYSLDLAPTDYDLFRSLSNSLRDKLFDEEDGIMNHLNEFFSSKPREFYEAGIHALPIRWQEVIDQDGEYIID